jgi:hypothetical protein
MKSFLYGIIFYSFFIISYEILVNVFLYLSLALKLDDLSILCLIGIIMLSYLYLFLKLKTPKHIHYILYIIMFIALGIVNFNAGTLNNRLFNRKTVFIGIKYCRTLFFVLFITISYLKIIIISKKNQEKRNCSHGD